MSEALEYRETNTLTIACPHVIKGNKIFYEKKGHAYCIDCFDHLKRLGVDENGYLKVQKDDPVVGALRTVCGSCLRLMKSL